MFSSNEINRWCTKKVTENGSTTNNKWHATWHTNRYYLLCDICVCMCVTSERKINFFPRRRRRVNTNTLCIGIELKECALSEWRKKGKGIRSNKSDERQHFPISRCAFAILASFLLLKNVLRWPLSLYAIFDATVFCRSNDSSIFIHYYCSPYFGMLYLVCCF